MGCIYKHTSRTSGKVYIGLTINDMKSRWRQHKCNALTGEFTCPHFHAAIAKYGADDFEHEILFESDSLDELNEKEIFFIKEYDSINLGYNLKDGGGSSTYEHTDEAKHLMSVLKKEFYANLTDEQRVEYNRNRLSVLGTDENREKVSLGIVAWYESMTSESRQRLYDVRVAAIKSDSCRAKMSASATKRQARQQLNRFGKNNQNWQKLEVFTMNGETIVGSTEAAAAWVCLENS